MIDILSFTSGIITIASGLFGLYKAIIEKIINQKELEKVIRDVQEHNYIQITPPKEGKEINTSIYDQLSGSKNWTIPKGYQLCVLAWNENRYFIMSPYPDTDKDSWHQKNIRLTIPGQWKLHICLANKRGKKWIDKKVKREDWSGFKKLPPGILSVNHIVVIRIFTNPLQHVIASLSITTPRELEVIKNPVYEWMSGTYIGELPEEFKDYQFWVLARERYNYFLMAPPPQFWRQANGDAHLNSPSRISETLKNWSQTNIRLASTGRWELHMCLVNKRESRKFQKRIEAGDFSALFPELRKGIHSIQCIVVRRQLDKGLDKRLERYKHIMAKEHDALEQQKVTIMEVKKTENRVNNHKKILLSGQLRKVLPVRYKLWLFIQKNDKYYHSTEQVRLRPQAEWYHSGFDIIKPGPHNIHICLVSKHAYKWLKLRSSQNILAGFSEIPEGVRILKTIGVTNE